MNANSAPRMRLRSAIFEAACWIAILAVYGWYLLNRGTWNDEFWTIWLGDPSVRLGEAVNDRWLSDVHPPLYSAYSRLVQELAGPGRDALRLAGAVLLAGAALLPLFLTLVRNRAAPVALIAFTVILGAHFSLFYAVSIRAYALMIPASYVFAAGFYAWLADTRGGLVACGAFISASLLLAFSHYFGFAFVVVVLSVAVVMFFLRGERRRALVVSGGLGLVVASMLPWIYYHADFMLHQSQEEFHGNTSLAGAARVYADFFAKSLYGLIPILAACMIISAVSRDVRQRVLLSLQGEALLILCAATLAYFCVLFAVDRIKPLLFDRYLLPTIGIVAMSVAAIMVEILGTQARLLVLLSVAVMSLVNLAHFQYKSGFWDSTAEIVGEELARCPSSKIYAIADDGIREGHEEIRNQTRVRRFSYEYTAKRFGFTFTYLESVEEITPPEGACPSILWVDHMQAAAVANISGIEELKRAHLVPDFANGATIRKGMSGLVIVLQSE